MRLIEPAVDDLVALNRKDPQIVRWVIKKFLLLERDPEAGRELKGALIGWRKLTVGDRDWRIIWRVTHDMASGIVVVDVAEVWAVGARSDAEVYHEMKDRVARLGNSPSSKHLAEVIDRLGAAAGVVAPKSEPQEAEQAPEWLLKRLTHTVGMPRQQAENLTIDEAMDVWTAWASRSPEHD